jgi:N-methylhydantoinase A
MLPESSLRIGIDIGGTFTDFVIFNPTSGDLHTFKLLSTPEDPAQVVFQGMKRIYAAADFHTANFELHVIHGSTVATNALLERKGAKAALITTQGFGDVLLIGRQNRPSLYDFSIDPPPPLIPEHLRFEVSERVDHTGQVLKPIDSAQIDSIISTLESSSLDSIAVCLLFSFLYPTHEQVIAQRLRESGYFVSISSEILPEYREYERTSTTVVNAYVTPVLDRYLAQLGGNIHGGENTHLRVMQSNGGAISVSEARRAGVRCILSGPAGGVIGAQYIAELIGTDHLMPQSAPNPETHPQDLIRVITFDMGGTSTDVSLIKGVPSITTEAQVGGCPIRIPVLDIHTIGAGGGSIARIDLGGVLRVGPESAGADPGPACYGRGDPATAQPTVTDANLILGRLPAHNFLGGEMYLDINRARHTLESLGAQLGLDSIQVGLGVVEVINAHMERALRLISSERGHDPRDFTLLSFGGAGGLHAIDLARRLGISRVVIPPMASTLSAFGMLVADVVKDYSQTVMFPGDIDDYKIIAALNRLIEIGQHDMHCEGIAEESTIIERYLDMRYRGQSYELHIPLRDNVLEQFHSTHHQEYGYSLPGTAVEIVNVRIRVIGKVIRPWLFPQPVDEPDPSSALVEFQPIYLSGDQINVPFYRGEMLTPGNQIPGPAVVFRNDTTVLIDRNDQAWVDSYHNLVIAIGE